MQKGNLLKEQLFLPVMLGLVILLFHAQACLAQQLDSLFVTPRARQVGDVVTVIISESSLASQSTKTDMGKRTATGGKVSSLFEGSQGTVATLPTWEWEHKNNFQGSGSTQRKGTLIAKISAQITEILPNGNFRIQGKRIVKVNNEEQIISIEGIIRPMDINEDNTIYSTYIADARIRYEGRGVLGENQRPGILSRIFSWLGIF